MRERENKQYLITLPKRGIKIMPPLETMEKMKLAREGQRVGTWSEEEKLRLRLLISCPIMKKRYPDREDGKRFMDEVDYARREELFSYAIELSEHVVQNWKMISQTKEIAVILYGSTARGLVKKPNNPDPSNLDLVVMGNITEDERLGLLDAIRPKRCELQSRILATCVNIPSENIDKFGNAGVFVQNVNKLKVNNYSTALEYIRGRGTALYDPDDIWFGIEKEALAIYAESQKRKRRSNRFR